MENTGAVERLADIAAANEEQLRSIASATSLAELEALDGFSDLPLISDKLNAAEKKLFDENPIVGAGVLLNAISAKSAALKLYEGSEAVQHNGNGDAFRHMYWNFLMADSTVVGVTWAKKWADAHETVSSAAIETKMDNYNNGRGRVLAGEGASGDKKKLREYVGKGSCRIISGGSLVQSTKAGEKN
ncbi:hypothetical protein [Roseovarius sp. M141]|uniref:DUF6973 domain-containing protein n=1 Tax=Roseovarius sp. M141 TaxID=2583806 RepID=UPI0020CFE5F7|nr:hypothetical protein [Roseovarius sp. M141]MCQ0093386.1 hypothetical protein [Roseovarius sp. M141]